MKHLKAWTVGTELFLSLLVEEKKSTHTQMIDPIQEEVTERAHTHTDTHTHKLFQVLNRETIVLSLKVKKVNTTHRSYRSHR